jgi:DNA polymerase I-like protein with 3'-5' exonuclease and polymerase domains
VIELGKLPNLRKLIVPDEGYVILDMDLERADLYAVAWDSGCQLLKDRLRHEDVHTKHAIEFLGKSTKRERDLMKKLAHAGDYLVGVRTASLQTGLPEAKIRAFITYWYDTYPEIPQWHRTVESQLYKDRTIRNAFGYRRVFFDRLEDCLPEAVAWIAQSTVAIVINKCLDNIIRCLPSVQPLLQVHDSLTMQIPRGQEDVLIPLIRDCSKVTIPYPDPLIIPVGFKISSTSWGDVKDYHAREARQIPATV